MQTFTDLATMEGANEAGRRATNAILAASGSRAARCRIWNLHEPAALRPLRWHDQRRYDAGLPWVGTGHRIDHGLGSVLEATERGADRVTRLLRRH